MEHLDVTKAFLLQLSRIYSWWLIDTWQYILVLLVGHSKSAATHFTHRIQLITRPDMQEPHTLMAHLAWFQFAICRHLI